MYVRRNSWLTGPLIPAVGWCGLLLAAAFAVSEQGFGIPFLMVLVSLSGWAGKFVAIAVVLGQPAGSYLQDNGGSIKVYTPAEV